MEPRNYQVSSFDMGEDCEYLTWISNFSSETYAWKYEKSCFYEVWIVSEIGMEWIRSIKVLILYSNELLHVKKVFCDTYFALLSVALQIPCQLHMQTLIGLKIQYPCHLIL